jgi:predicted transcriptional regulator of viral defense system
MLYWRRVESPYKPVITIHEFETTLKIPKEQLEFNLWFLRDKGWIARSDNACFVITAEGVSAAEAVEDAVIASDQQEEEVLEAVCG